MEEAFTDLKAIGDSNRYRNIITEAISSTRITHPEAQLVCLVDKKAFLAEERKLITELLTEEGVYWTFKTADIKKLIKSSDTPSVSVEVDADS